MGLLGRRIDMFPRRFCVCCAGNSSIRERAVFREKKRNDRASHHPSTHHDSMMGWGCKDHRFSYRTHSPHIFLVHLHCAYTSHILHACDTCMAQVVCSAHVLSFDSLSPFSCFTRPCSCCSLTVTSRRLPVHDFLPHFPDLKAQVKRTMARTISCRWAQPVALPPRGNPGKYPAEPVSAQNCHHCHHDTPNRLLG